MRSVDKRSAVLYNKYEGDECVKIRLCAFADEAGKTACEQLSALRENNISLIEMRKIDGRGAADYSPKELEAYRERFSQAGIEVFSLGSAIGKARESVDIDEYIKLMQKACDAAKALGAGNIRAFSFYPRFIRHDKSVVIDKLKRLTECAAENGLNYCHENEKGIYGSTAERVSELREAIPDMKIIYDPANFLQCSQSPAKTLRAFAPVAEYFHIKDACGKRVVPAGFGEGRLDLLVTGINRDTVFSVEPHLLAFKGCKSFNESELAGKFNLSTGRGRFDCAVASCRLLLENNGYVNKGSYYEKCD